MGMWDYMNSLAGAGPQSPLPTGGGLPQFPTMQGGFADFMRGFNPRNLPPKPANQPFSPFSIGGQPQFFNPMGLGAPQQTPFIQAQSRAARSGGLNTSLPDFFGGGRMRPQGYRPNPNVRLMLPQRGVPNLPTFPPMNWGGGYNGGF